MMKMMASAFTARLASVLAVGSLLLLSACGLPDPALDNFYEPATHYDRYPIEVEKARVTKVLRVKLGVLRREEVNAVVNFAQDARKNAESKITVSWPSGNSRLRAPAA